MPIIQKIHNSGPTDKSTLNFLEKLTTLLASWGLKNKPKKRSAFEYKYQISLENSSQNEGSPVNRYLSMPKLQAAGKFLSDLISYLSGKNIIAASKICPDMGSGVAA